MQIYTVHTKSRSPSFVLEREEMEKIVFVKEGFCWTAMLFTVLWAGWHGMWRHGAMLVVAALLLSLIFDAMEVAAPLQTLVALGALLIVGFEGNNWRREELEKKEYSLIAVVAGENRDAAIFRYLKDIAGSAPGNDQPAAA
ncbi:MAG: DUF2628 domain-containing protein [Alphaproteobacteria bacterium]|nr:DUF2628 domain-containing protein [Alphaproteobacteria bacterium]